MPTRTLLALLLTAPLSTGTGQAIWQIDPQPLVDVAGLGPDGTVVFGEPAGATRLADGSLLIADRAENTIRVVDAGGGLVRSLGREGSGPGEFRTVLWAGGCGADTLLVWDLAERRATMVGAGGVGRQFVVPSGDTGQMPFAFSCSPSAAMAYLSVPRPDRNAPPPEDPRFVPVTASAYRIGAEGAITQRIGALPAGEVMMLTSPNGGRGSAPRPLGAASSIAAVDGRTVISSPDSAFVRVMRADGGEHRMPVPITPRAPTRDEFDAAVQAVSSFIPPQVRSAMTEKIAEAPMPETLPPIAALFVDPAGLLWVQGTPPGSATAEFVVMAVDGRQVATVRIAAPLTVYEVGRDYVLGRYTDADDEIHVAVYRLTRE